jgi:K+-transporting ATPase A subunit
VDNFDLNLVDSDSDYLVAVAVDCNNHILIDLVDKKVDFVVGIEEEQQQQQHYFSVMMMMMMVVVVIVLVHILPLHHYSILPKKKQRTTLNK